MGCNCKQVNKINKKFPSFIIPEYEKRGVCRLLQMIGKGLWKFLGFCIAFIFMIIGMPIVIIMAMISYIRHGRMLISLPFLGKNKGSE